MVKNAKGKRIYVKWHELVFISSESVYELDTDDVTKINRSTKLTTHRFCVETTAIPILMKAMADFIKADPTKES